MTMIMMTQLGNFVFYFRLQLYDTTLQDNADFGALECEKDYSSTDDGQAVSQTGQTTLKVVGKCAS